MQHGMIFKTGGYTVSIDGVAVGGRTPSDAVLKQSAQPAVREVMGTGTQWRLASFAVELAMRMHRSDVGWDRVAVKFFEPDGETHGWAPGTPAAGRYVRLAANLHDAHLAKIALHEARHVIQGYAMPGMTKAAAEADAEGFAARWTGPVMAAWRASGGDLSLVSLDDGPHPYRGDRNGAVHVDRRTGRVHAYYPRSVTAPWQEVR